MQIARFETKTGVVISTTDCQSIAGYFETMAFQNGDEVASQRTKTLREARFAHCEMVERHGGRDSIAVGDVLVYQWGYGQTNTDFFEVLRTTRTQVVIRQIQAQRCTQDGWGGTAVPLKGAFIGEPMRRKVSRYNGQITLKMDHGVALIWRGWPVQWSECA